MNVGLLVKLVVNVLEELAFAHKPILLFWRESYLVRLVFEALLAVVDRIGDTSFKTVVSCILWNDTNMLARAVQDSWREVVLVTVSLLKRGKSLTRRPQQKPIRRMTLSMRLSQSSASYSIVRSTAELLVSYLSSNLVNTGRLLVVKPGIVKHQTHVITVLPRIGVLALLKFGANGRKIHWVLDDVEVVWDLKSDWVNRFSEGWGFGM